VHVTEMDGVFFFEEVPRQCETIQEINLEIDDQVWGGAQLKSLADVKRAMAREAKRFNGNAIVRFEYGQRCVGFWRSLFSLDDVSWYGRGIVAHVTNPGSSFPG